MPIWFKIHHLGKACLISKHTQIIQYCTITILYYTIRISIVL